MTLLQTIWLGSIIPNPRSFYHQFHDGHMSDNWRAFLCSLGEIMLRRGKITAEERASLGDCQLSFESEPEAAPTEAGADGLGHDGDVDAEPGATAPAKPPSERRAPSVQPDQQP